MEQLNLGGNLLSSAKKSEYTLFNSSEYFYSYYRKVDQILDDINTLKSCTIFCLSGSLIINANGEAYDLSKNKYISIHGHNVNNISGSAEILLVGTKELNGESSDIKLMSLSDTKKVEKPWGAEYWIESSNPNYSFKHILLNEGFKTSLQYHEKKVETNFLYKGEANFYYNTNQNGIKDIQNINIESQIFQEMQFIHVKKNTIHRIEAISDLLLFEASTPDLDDVIRIQDDSNRANGRIQDEHK